MLIAAATYLPGLAAPPSLMDDVDAAEALQAKNMLLSGDWVTQRLDSTLYLDKAPLKYWLTASLYRIFGVYDWVARLPTALAAIALCWLLVHIGRQVASPKAGFYSGLVLATSPGLYLFTRTIIPDVILTLFISLSVWFFFRALESARPFPWAMAMWSSIACAVLTKGLIGLFFPVATALAYLLVTRTPSWPKLYPLVGSLLFLLIAAPWHILATFRNPPLLDFTLHAGAHFGNQFRGFFWFYFINEQLLRFLNERWPRDYNTVPRLWFWLYHLVWFFPWTFCLPLIAKLKFQKNDAPGRFRILLACWIAVVMLFFTFSTTQEYYSMPIYPAIALLLGAAMVVSSKWVNWAAVTLFALSIALFIVLFKVWQLPTPADIYTALSQHPNLYTFSLGHMADLTIPAFAYLKWPLALAAASFFIGSLTARKFGYVALALMMVGFFQAAHLALIAFDPYLSSRAIADELNRLPKGDIIVCGRYNPLSSIFFYSRDQALINNADLDILEYGSLAAGAPKITIGDNEMKQMWHGAQRIYIVAKAGKKKHLDEVLGNTHVLLQSADKYLLVNQ